MNDDRKIIVRSIINKVDPENVLTWVLPQSKGGIESDKLVKAQYEENQVASLLFTDDNSIRVSVHYHVCDFDLCDKDSFDPEKVALFMARGLYYELLKDGFEAMETNTPVDWKVNFVKEFFSWATWIAVFSAGIAAIWLIKH